MPSNPSVRLTKKQRKATAFRERGKKSKGVPHEDTGRPNPAPGRPRRRPSTGDNGEGHNHHDEDYSEDDEDANAVPTMEDQDQALAEMAGDTEAVSKKPDGGRPVRVQKAAVAADSAAAQKKKDRDKDKKRSRADDGGEARPATKRARLARGSDEIPPPLAREGGSGGDEATGMSVLEDGEGGHGASDAKDKEGKLQRYILFVGMSYPSTITQVSLPVTLVVEGNLKYTTTREAIQNHFSQCGAVSPPPLSGVPLTHNTDPPPVVRLLTPKATRAGATVTKSKGCAFLEFSTRSALQTGLRLHQSELDGRRVNVELTAGGGGKGDTRLAKVKARNKQLAAQRVRSSLVSFSFSCSVT